MNGPQLVFTLCCLGFVLLLVLVFEVLIFRAACSMCRVHQPGFLRTIGLVVTILAVLAGVDLVLSGVLYEVYTATNYPLWEAFVVDFFLALPVHMGICTVIHAKFVRIPLSHGLSVWLVERLIKFALAVVLVGIVALVIAIGKGQ